MEEREGRKRREGREGRERKGGKGGTTPTTTNRWAGTLTIKGVRDRTSGAVRLESSLDKLGMPLIDVKILAGVGAHIVHELSDIQVVDEKEGIAYLHAAVEVRRAALGYACDHSTLGIGEGTAEKFD